MTKKIIIPSALAIALALGVLSPALATDTTSTTSTKPGKEKRELDLACMRTAIEKRENTIQTAFGGYSGYITSALTTRKTGLLAAWQIESKKDRVAAYLKTWKTWREARQGAKKTYNTARIDAWKLFKTDRQACGSGPTGENPGHDEL